MSVLVINRRALTIAAQTGQLQRAEAFRRPFARGAGQD